MMGNPVKLKNGNHLTLTAKGSLIDSLAKLPYNTHLATKETR